MPFNFVAAERLRRLEKGTLSRRGDEALPFIDETTGAGGVLLLDTCVYIDRMQDRVPELVQELIDVRVVAHSTVSVQELMHTVGVLDPKHPDTADVVDAVKDAVDGMPDHRTLTPDADTLGRASVLAGVLCRSQGYSKDDRMRALHDCVLFLQALKHGITVLSRNVKDFDYLLQLMPQGRVLLYRRDND